MSWLSTSAFEPRLPEHCTPTNDFLHRFSSTVHTCIPTPLAFISNLLGTLSIVAWLCAQLPQIWKNWSIQSTSGLSIGFLVVWCLGDLSNLSGALLTHQASWQVAIGSYYVFVDLCLVGQWVWFEKLRHGHPVFRVWGKGNGQRQVRKGGGGGGDGAEGRLEHVVIEGISVPGENKITREDSGPDNDFKGEPAESSQLLTRPRIIFQTPTFSRDRGEEGEKASPSFSSTSRSSNTIYRAGSSSSSSVPSPSPRTMLLIACLIALVHASPTSRSKSISIMHVVGETAPHTTTTTTTTTPLEMAGTILSWISTLLYLSSRFPQLIKNWRRKSTEGLSPLLFAAAFAGNFFYSSALLTNPCLWNDFGAYGGGGWADEHGSDRLSWGLAALPFFLGAFGVLGLDGSVGVQFWLYGEDSLAKLVVVEEEEEDGSGRGGEHGGSTKWHWRRVRGWMRGWIPSTTISTTHSSSHGPGSNLPPSERDPLSRADHTRQVGTAGYGAL